MILWVAGVWALGLWAQPVPDADATKRLHALFAEAIAQNIEERPEVATLRGRTEFNDRWSDLSNEAAARQQQRRQRTWQALQEIDRGKLSAADQMNYDLFTADLREQLEAPQRRNQ